MLSREEVVVRKPEEKHAGWQSLLANNQYNQIATCLEKAYLDAVKQDNVEKVALLAAARQLCASCKQLQQEVSLHEQAFHQFETRRDQIGFELNKLLEMVDLEPETADLAKPPTLWQRVQRVFRHAPVNSPAEKRNSPKIENDENAENSTKFLATTGQNVLASAELEQTPTSEKTKATKAKLELILNPAASHYEPGARNLIIYSLGPFRVYQNEQLLNGWNGLKSLMILKYLVGNRCRPVAKEILMDVFWPEADAEGARRNLHQAIYSLRQTLKQQEPDFQHVLYENDCYLLNPEINVWLDFREFEGHVREGRNLLMAGQKSAAMGEYGIAESLYQGKFMEEDLYDEWPQTERQRLQNLYLEIADKLSGYYIDQGELPIAIALSQKILLHDKCFEQAYYRLMLCYRAQGQRHLAIRYFLNCQETLQEELGLLPSKETAELYSSLIN